MRNGWHAAPAGSIAGLAALALVSVLVSACGDDGADEANDDAPAATADTTPTTLSPEDEVEQAYLEFWDMATRLAENPDPDDPEIAERASGQARANLVDGLTTLRAANQRSELGDEYRHDVLSVEIDGDTATVEDCAVDDSRIVDADSGAATIEGVGTELLSVRMEQSNGAWVVVRLSQLDAWDGAVGCH